MAELGWLSIQVPRPKGGLGLGLAASATLPPASGMRPFRSHSSAARSWRRGAWPAARADSCGERALARVVAGAQVAAVAWQGDAGRLEIDACGVSARATPTGAVPSGSSRFVLPASADAFIVAATGSQGLALFWVPRDTQGLEVRAEPLCRWRRQRVAAGHGRGAAARQPPGRWRSGPSCCAMPSTRAPWRSAPSWSG